MKIKGNICETGGKKLPNGRFVNEDGLVTFSTKSGDTKYDFIILMDGATGLGKDHQIIEGYTSAEWYVKFVMGILQRVLTQNPSYDLQTAVDFAISKAIGEIKDYEEKNGITLEEYQKPSAGLSLLRTDGKTTEIYLIGDTQTLVAYKDGRVTTVDNPNQKALQRLDKSVLDRMVELAKERDCDVIDTRTDDEIEKMLQVNRSKKNSNCADGYWVCGTTEGTAKHGVCVSFNNSELSGFVLASDGFDFSVLDLDEKQVYKLICERGTEVVSKLIRRQQELDPKCNRFPRFKQGDDLTAVHFDYLARDKKFDYER